VLEVSLYGLEPPIYNIGIFNTYICMHAHIIFKKYNTFGIVNAEKFSENSFDNKIKNQPGAG
jgi:hypothetical protein